ncbi:hypothetical protein G7062_07565 [Erysipelothrix sp. HDW6C]|uniref:hypothetical protein n=1 Tax=Erysipelothrix sp. HDW6C TaxID=2714930 RepID=UPI0014077FC0|nr:hypothetical protein [Erysipelothrix sp. HDW6C]QIK70151.1 hypothetical protein G7062_07565 [Erysipelothrix sp. HDW6C]
MSSKRGTILLSVLAVFITFISWTQAVLVAYNGYMHDMQKLKVIDQRIAIEARIFPIIRLGSEYYAWVVNQNIVIAYRYENILFVSILGNMSYWLEYDIMEDDSFKLKTMED